MPDLVRVEKRPIDSQLRQLKTELAYARADLNKLERRADTPGEILDKARARLQTPSARCKTMSPLEAPDDRLQQAMKLVLLAMLPGLLALFWFYGWGVLINLILASPAHWLVEAACCTSARATVTAAAG